MTYWHLFTGGHLPTLEAEVHGILEQARDMEEAEDGLFEWGECRYRRWR